MTLADRIDDTASQAFAAIGFHQGEHREEITYATLWADATAAAPAVHRLSTEVDGQLRLGVLLTNDRASVVILMAAIAAGVTVCSLPIPRRGSPLDEYLHELATLSRTAGIEVLIAHADHVPFLSVPGVDVWSSQDVLAETERGPVSSAEHFGIIQHTAATTGRPKGIRVSDRQICDHVDLILERINPGPVWNACSWLPLSHDMGLIGMLLTSTAYGGSTWGHGGLLELLRPEDFVRRPWIWLEACSKVGASITAAPDFAFRLATRHVRRHRAIDLSRLAYVIVGGERVRSETLASFETNFAPAGFANGAFAPSYGLAEACLAVTMPERGQGWLEQEVEATTVLGEDTNEGALHMVSSGRPLGRVEVQTRPGADKTSQIVIGGPQVLTEYVDGSRPIIDDGMLVTGDIGTIIEGQLYVAGRIDEVLVLRGQNYSAHRLEEQIARTTRRPPHTIAAINTGAGGLALAVELDGDVDRQQVSALVDKAIRQCVFSVGIRPAPVHVVGPGELPRTSVGKLQRRRLADAISAL